MSAVPKIIDGLVAKLRTDLDGVAQVLDGPELTNEYGDYVMVGIDDPDRAGYLLAAESTEEWAAANTTAYDQEGVITIAILCYTGGGDSFKVIRDKAFTIKQVIDLIIKNSSVLGIAELVWLSPSSHTYSQTANPKGLVAFLVVRVGFRARY